MCSCVFIIYTYLLWVRIRFIIRFIIKSIIIFRYCSWSTNKYLHMIINFIMNLLVDLNRTHKRYACEIPRKCVHLLEYIFNISKYNVKLCFCDFIRYYWIENLMVYTDSIGPRYHFYGAFKASFSQILYFRSVRVTFSMLMIGNIYNFNILYQSGYQCSEKIYWDFRKFNVFTYSGTIFGNRTMTDWGWTTIYIIEILTLMDTHKVQDTLTQVNICWYSLLVYALGLIHFTFSMSHTKQ